VAASLSSGELSSRDRVGAYTVLERISSGAMGAVYRARRDDSGEEVALKRLTDVRHSARFEIEARLLAALDHPRIAQVQDYLEDDSGSYLVMTLVDGIDLGRHLQQRGAPGLPVNDAIRWTLQTCEALAYVHEQHVVHRDVKPQNLILGEDGIVLVDFGIARDLSSDGQGTEGIGTPGFMAPEVLVAGAVSPRSDVFGVAATAWTLIAGAPPPYGEAKGLAAVAPGVHPALAAALRTALELDPERRTPSVSALAEALGSPLARGEGAPLAAIVDAPVAPRPLLEAVVRAAAGVFDAAAASIALADPARDGLVYQAAWGAGARDLPGIRLERGAGLAGNVLETGEAVAVPSCRGDQRFAEEVAAGTGYVPNTMLVLPIKRGPEVVGVLSLLDRRDGGGYRADDLARAQPLADLALAAMDLGPGGAGPGAATETEAGFR
jgi:hypothetical protein